MKIPDRRTRRAIISQTRKSTRQVFPNLDHRAGCLYLAWAFLHSAKQAGLQGGKLYAGEAHWPCSEQSRFGYGWEPDSGDHRARLAAGMLPEVHVWAGFGSGAVQQDEYGPFIGPEIMVDLTTGSWPHQCRALIGEPWTAALPPDHFWDKPERLPPAVHYRPYREAGLLAQSLLLNHNRKYSHGGDNG